MSFRGKRRRLQDSYDGAQFLPLLHALSPIQRIQIDSAYYPHALELFESIRTCLLLPVMYEVFHDALVWYGNLNSIVALQLNQ